MAKLVWDPINSLHESGVDRCVLYLEDSLGVAWSGITAIDESEPESSQSILYLDGTGRMVFEQGGNYSANLSAFIYPDEFLQYDGFDGYLANQSKSRFGLSYRTNHGAGYKIHLVYNATVGPTTRTLATLSSKPDVAEFQWTILTSATPIPGAKPSAQLVIDATTARYPDAVAELESIIYGSDDAPARLPSPDEVLSIFESYVVLRITYNGDGTWTATGPDEMIEIFSDTGRFEITSPSALYVNSDLYQISSY